MAKKKLSGKKLDEARNEVSRAGVAFEQLKANGKISLDEDGARWADDVSSALDAAENALIALADESA